MPKSLRWLIGFAAILFLAWNLGQANNNPTLTTKTEIRLRRPIAMLLADEGNLLLVANRESGTITLVDTTQKRVLGETRVAGRLADLAATPDRNLLLAADEQAGEVILLTRHERILRELQRLKVGLGPVSLQVSEDGRWATVACLWPRRIVVVDLAAVGKEKPGPGEKSTIIDLPFAPRRQLLVPGGNKLIVADAFGGKLAVVDLERKKVESLRELSGHNLRGLALDRQGKNLLLTHQMLNARGHTTAGEIRTSNVITNHVRAISLAAILEPGADIFRHDRLYPLGDVERGAGDPAGVAESPDGKLLVALAGVNELAVGRPEKALWTRLPVGSRPTALALDPVRRRAYVANTFADSISVVDYQVPRVLFEIRLGKTPDLGPAERGEVLFSDARLSFESWYSCHSCHPDGHTNGRLNDNFSDDSFGTPKRVLSLLGVKDTGPWAWNGQMRDLETQVRTSITSTMQGPAPSERQVGDLAAYLRTLPSPPALLRARQTLDPAAVKRGRKIFIREKCASCHPPPTYTSPKTYDVGLRDEAGNKNFNPPSLRGLSQAGPYFHDNRALSLEEVFARYRHQLAGELTRGELQDLLHFLNSL